MIEIERRFLVQGQSWREQAVSRVKIRQGYLSTEPDRIVRVRVLDDQHAFLTLKGKRVGYSRAEYEYAIPVDDGLSLLDSLCRRPIIEKFRHTVRHGGREWVVDEFIGANADLVLAEIELAGEADTFEAPGWIGREVSLDDRYSNSALQAAPYSTW